MVVWLFLAVPWVCLRFVIFPDHTHFAYFVFLLSRDGCVALPRGAVGLCIVVFPDYTHLLFCITIKTFSCILKTTMTSLAICAASILAIY